MSISASHAGEGEYTNNPNLIRSRFPVSGILFIISGKDCAFANILLTSYNAHLTEYPVWQHLSCLIRHSTSAAEYPNIFISGTPPYINGTLQLMNIFS